MTPTATASTAATTSSRVVQSLNDSEGRQHDCSCPWRAFLRTVCVVHSGALVGLRWISPTSSSVGMPAAKVAIITAGPLRCAARNAARSAANTWSSLPESRVLRFSPAPSSPRAAARLDGRPGWGPPMSAWRSG